MAKHFSLVALASAAAAFTFATAAKADTLSVSPILLEIPGNVGATVENLENKGDTVITAQARVYRWTVKDGKEILVPTTDVVASPPQLKIQPGGKATVRIVRLNKQPVVGEEAYRLLIDDIPPPPDKPGENVRFAIRNLIPVFFQAPGIKADLQWTAKLAGDELHIHATNAGQMHARLAELVALEKDTRVGGIDGLVGYVMPGTSADYKIKVKGVHAGSTLTLKASLNNGKTETTVQVQ